MKCVVVRLRSDCRHRNARPCIAVRRAKARVWCCVLSADDACTDRLHRLTATADGWRTDDRIDNTLRWTAVANEVSATDDHRLILEFARAGRLVYVTCGIDGTTDERPLCAEKATLSHVELLSMRGSHRGYEHGRREIGKHAVGK